jgi:NAD(P)H-hydrate repair Nnr-like enzyme with NAD(P)H-hydrate epimerase domain
MFVDIVTDDDELKSHHDAVIDAINGIGICDAAVEAIQLDIESVKQEVLEAHAHIEALIGAPSDIPSLGSRKRDGTRVSCRRAAPFLLFSHCLL